MSNPRNQCQVSSVDPVKLNLNHDSLADRKSKQNAKHHQRQTTDNGWANEDVNQFREEEFDFQANLDMFDKAKVFAEIQARTNLYIWVITNCIIIGNR